MQLIVGKGNIAIGSTPERAWDFITNPDNWKLLPHLKHAHVTSPVGKIRAGHDVYLHLVTRGVTHIIKIKFTEFERPSKMVWTGTVKYLMFGSVWPSMLISGSMDFEKVKAGVHIWITMYIYPRGNVFNTSAFYWMTRVLNLGHVFNNTINLLLLSFQLKLEEQDSARRKEERKRSDKLKRRAAKS